MIIPIGTVKKKNEIHIVYDLGGAHKSIHTGKYITNITWKKPTNALVTNIIQKFLVKANTPTNSPLRTADVTIVFLASIFANNTGLMMLPITLPT